MSFDALTLTVLDPEEQEVTSSTLGAFRAGKPLVLDFWTTRCVNCPAALAKLDGQAPKYAAKTAFASCALSLNSEAEGTQEQVLEQLEGQFENLKHSYMTFEEKEAAKAAFGFSSVPFCVVFSAAGAVLFKGNPKELELATFDFAAEPTAAAPAVEAVATSMEKVAVASPAKPLGEANRATTAAPVSLGFGNDDEDF